jgi:hypothetical protein
MPARRKMAAHHKRAVTKVMKAARKRKPTARRVSFTKDEKSTLRHVMKSHSRKRKAPAKRKTTRKRKSPARKAVVRKRKSPAKRKTRTDYAWWKRHTKRMTGRVGKRRK